MHLLTTSSTNLDEIVEAIDLGQPPGEIATIRGSMLLRAYCRTNCTRCCGISVKAGLPICALCCADWRATLNTRYRYANPRRCRGLPAICRAKARCRSIV